MTEQEFWKHDIKIKTCIEEENVLLQETSFRAGGQYMHNISEGMEFPGYACQNCERRYSLKKSLLRHLKFECGKEPQFQCPYCQVKTTRRSSLMKHIRNQHPGVPSVS